MSDSELDLMEKLGIDPEDPDAFEQLLEQLIDAS